MYAALLDACVLVPSALCDTLLRLADHQLFRPLWSAQILTEVDDAVLRIHPNLPPDRIAARLRAMNSAFEDASVTAYAALVAGLDLPDPDDRHVLAAAIAGGAQSLVTFNLKDFPAPTLHGHGIEAVHPDRFLLDQLDLMPGEVIMALKEQIAALRNPPRDLADVLNALTAAGAPSFADTVRLMLL